MSGAQRDNAPDDPPGEGKPTQDEQKLGLEDVSFEEEERETVPFSGSARAAGTIEVKVVGRTDVGLVREHNEDNFLLADLATGSRDPATFHEVTREGLVLAVCDGMGGAAAGEVASQLAVDTLLEILSHGGPAPDHDGLARNLVLAIEEAGTRIFEAARADRTRRGMGTTATVALLMDDTLFVGQVGDSRAYILRNGELKQITKDQSLVNQLIEAGQLTEAEAEAFEHSNIILQALGTTEHVSVDLTFIELRKGDRLLMCSDGLSGLVHGDVMREVMIEYRALDGCCERLIELAKAAGGHDNVTVLLAEFSGDGLAAPSSDQPAGYHQYPLPFEGDSAEEDDPSAYTPTDGDGLLEAFAPLPLEPRSSPRSSGAGGYWVVVVVLVALLGAAYFWLVGGASLEVGAAPSADRATTMAREPAQVEVIVRTTLAAQELLIDGEIVAGPPSEGRWIVQLSPGEHRFEARIGAVPRSAAHAEIREGVPATVVLVAPEPREDPPLPDEDPETGAVTPMPKGPALHDQADKPAAPKSSPKKLPKPKPVRALDTEPPY